MVFSRFGWYACLVAAPLYAGTIDVSSQSSVVLHDGDALTFAISAWSYQVHAPEFGAPADPSYVSFSLFTDPLIGALDLDFSLESNDGGTSAVIDDASLLSGYFQGSLYQGPVSMESGSLTMSPALSSQIFAGPAVLLVVEDTGGDVSLGLSPYPLLQSLEFSLSGGGFSVGGAVAAVTLQQAPSLVSGKPIPMLADSLGDGDPPDVPEPPSGALLALGRLCLGMLAHLSKRSRKPAG